MSHRSTLRPALALGAALPLAMAALAAPATAAPPDSYSSRTSGGQAFASWTEYDPDDVLGLPGNVHVGLLEVYQQPGYLSVFGIVEDHDCEPGEVPGGGHGGEEPPGEGFCDLVATRFLNGLPNTAFVADARTGTARLTGNLEVSSGGHGEPGQQLGRPTVDMTWTASGETFSFRRTETWTSGTTTYRSRVTGTRFAASVAGAIGRMGFDDDSDDVSTGSVESWRETSRVRVR